MENDCFKQGGDLALLHFEETILAAVCKMDWRKARVGEDRAVHGLQ